MDYSKLKKWALVAEIVGGAAVVLSLIFLGLEVRRGSEETVLNTQAMEVNAYQDLISQIMQINNAFLTSPQLAELWSRLENCREFNSEAEVVQINRYLVSVVRHGDMAYYQYEKGLIDGSRLNSALGILRSQGITCC